MYARFLNKFLCQEAVPQGIAKPSEIDKIQNVQNEDKDQKDFTGSDGRHYPQGEGLLTLFCSTVVSLLQETVLQQLLQCESFQWWVRLGDSLALAL
ncbi:hypothetical protein WISP_78935 [Willisornis vidua]|uniref:Uncharacterized protein n=1 Tax=Willisornis vidua TaxID=1566151 RepID=A0ABQ9D566_9PASS|nr:hypothetical protein WISP_78935 [Willisornis vidua]